jgi:hypothetical protein
MASGMLLVKMMNKRGERIEPCGLPAFTALIDNFSPPYCAVVEDDVGELAASSSQAVIAGLTSSQLNSAQLKALRKEHEQAQSEAREKKTRDNAEKEKHLANRQVRH